MDTETPLPTPEPPSTRRRRNVFAGALLGAVALTASVVGVSAVAGAQDEPEVDEPVETADELDDADIDDSDRDDGEPVEMDIEIDDPAWAAFDQCITDALGGLDEDAELTDEEWDALESQFEAAEQACEELLPEDVKAEIEAFGPFEECVDGQLDGIAELEVDDESELSDEDWKAFEEAWAAADEACFDLLPEDAKAEVQAFEAYDQCLTDAGFSDDLWDEGTFVFIETDEGGQSIQFGDTVGTVTITGDASGVSVATEGGVSVIDEAVADEAFETCEQLLPEDLFEIDEMSADDEMDELDEDDEDDDLDGEGAEDDSDDA